MKKRALLVGLNYRGTPNELRGCENDIVAMNEVLVNQFGFTDNSQRRMITGESGTTKNILGRLEWLVDGLVPGDYAFFHYSGHGSQCVDVDYNLDEEPDGLDEIICPSDLDWRTNIIRDDDFKRIFSRVPQGVHLTVVLDCCHSGTGLRDMMMPPEVKDMIYGPVRTRAIPMPTDISNRAYGLDLAPKTRGLTLDPQSDQKGLLISGCASNQTSADAWIQTERKYMGACTNNLIQILRERSFSITYGDLIQELNRKLPQGGYDQTPELSGDPKLFSETFLK